jgi:hypothetical protein
MPPPAAIHIGLATGTGTSRCTWVPSPSSPEWLSPQQYTRPSLVTPQP